MILVDTSVWIDHFRTGESRLISLLEGALVFVHPFVIGELALGNLQARTVILDALAGMPTLPVLPAEDILAFIHDWELQASGIGYVDAHLLASVSLSPGTSLWTRDRRLKAVAQKRGLAFDE